MVEVPLLKLRGFPPPFSSFVEHVVVIIVVWRLNEEIPVAILHDTGEELNQIFTEYEDGVIPIESVEVEGTTYTGSVTSGKNESVNEIMKMG